MKSSFLRSPKMLLTMLHRLIFLSELQKQILELIVNYDVM